jgi:DNA-binding NtrC family response regulator
MPDSSRDVWTGPRGELSQIEFQAYTAPAGDGDDVVSAGEVWLAGQTPTIERLRARATKIGEEGVAVVSIHGEPGTGKLRVAQWSHRCSSRCARPMLVLDADDPNIDARLARVLTTLATPSTAPGTLVLRNYDRAGGATLEQMLEILGQQVVELTCALFLISKRSPDHLRSASLLHAQLHARAGAVLTVPALRHREDDIPELARLFANEAARRYDKTIRGLSVQALSKLEAHAFPGNVRELAVMVEQAVLRSSGDWVTGDCFGGLGDETPIRATEASELVIRLPGSSLREIEIQALRLALRLSEGKIVRASELLGITRHALRRKLEKFGLTELRAPAANDHDSL